MYDLSSNPISINICDVYESLFFFTKFPYDLSQYMEHFSNNETQLESDNHVYEAASGNKEWSVDDII